MKANKQLCKAIIAFCLALAGCGPKEQLGPELVELGQLHSKQYNPSTTSIVTIATVELDGDGDVSIGTDEIEQINPAYYSLTFKCTHGQFTVRRTNGEETKLHNGDPVIIRYCQVYHVTKDGTFPYDLHFLSACLLTVDPDKVEAQSNP